MALSLYHTFIGITSFILYSINLIAWSIPFFILAIIKFLIFVPSIREYFDQALVWVAEHYVLGNKLWIKLLHRTQLEVNGLENLRYDEWYLICCNHQSWVDIFILQNLFHKKIPFLKFYIKQELIWIPIIGLACWALNFPFMKRYSKRYLEQNPEKKLRDMKVARLSMQKFMKTPTTVINFPEGTRFTHQKHKEQSSPYQFLLKPKAGGLAYALNDLSSQLKKVLDVTIVYPNHNPKSFFYFLCGKIDRIQIDIQHRDIDSKLTQGNYQEDQGYRNHVQNWVNDLWHDKDVLLTQKQMKRKPKSE